MCNWTETEIKMVSEKVEQLWFLTMLEAWQCQAVSRSITWIVRTFGTEVHGPQRMKSTDFVDPFTFHLAPPLSQ